MANTFSYTELSRLTLARAEAINSIIAAIKTSIELSYTSAEVDALMFGTDNFGPNTVTFAKVQQIGSMKVVGNVTGGTADVAEVSILDEDSMASDSATALATQQSIKAYVDTRALNAALPLQTGNSGKYITTDGTNASWAEISALSFTAVSADTALEASTSYRITATSAVTLTLPASPASGASIRILDITGANHTLARNGQTIMDAAEDVTLNIKGQDFQIWFDGSTWRLF
jgi:hypothetical protein